jgi:hypothetical protein
MRAYIQRWSLIKNSAEHVSDEREIDTFIARIRRSDLVEELGRSNPRMVAELMETTNRWDDGEDVDRNKRPRSPKDRNRNNQNRRRFLNFADYDGPSKVSAGFRSNNNNNQHYGYRKSGDKRYNNRDAPS